MASLVSSEEWPVLLKYLRLAAQGREKAVRNRKATIEDIRYSQGALDFVDSVRALTREAVRELKEQQVNYNQQFEEEPQRDG